MHLLMLFVMCAWGGFSWKLDKEKIYKTQMNIKGMIFKTIHCILWKVYLNYFNKKCHWVLLKCIELIIIEDLMRKNYLLALGTCIICIYKWKRESR